MGDGSRHRRAFGRALAAVALSLGATAAAEYNPVDATVRLVSRLRGAGVPADLRLVTTERSQACPEYRGTAIEGPYRGETILQAVLGADPTPVALHGHTGDATYCAVWDGVERFLATAVPSTCRTGVAEDLLLRRVVATLGLPCGGGAPVRRILGL